MRGLALIVVGVIGALGAQVRGSDSLEGAAPPEVADFAERAVTKVGFGSCAHQDRGQPIWTSIGAWGPDLFVMLGDNVYGDTEDMAVLRAKYAALGAKPEFRAVAEETPFLATWDDHDYGANDAGREYPMKATSKEVMLEFFGEPADSPRWSHEGIYHAVTLGPPGQRVQFILLDLRTFRSPLARRARNEREASREVGPYVPRGGEDVTMLGAAQWAWLDAQLREPAEFRVICLSTQLLPEFNGWEAWANLPDERAKLIDLIRETRAEGVVFISGDTHWAEFSLEEEPGLYSLVELTSSGLTEVWRAVAPNRNRIVGSYLGANYGQLEFDWSTDDPTLTLRIADVDGTVRLAHRVRRSELTFDHSTRYQPRTLAGEWHTEFGAMSLRIEGTELHGRYGDAHTLEGTVSESGVAHGTWRHRDGAAGGPFEFRLSRDGRHLLGAWAFDGDRAAGDGGLAFGWFATRRAF